MIHRENERSEHQKIRGAAYTLTFDPVILAMNPYGKIPA
jgi:hypothetical protein